MDSTQLALLALFLGAVIGAGLVGIIVAARNARLRVERQNSDRLPDGIEDVLHSMDDVAVVVDSSGLVLAVSHSAHTLALEKDVPLADGELRNLLKIARTAGTATETIRIRRGPLEGQERLVSARVTRLSERLLLLIARDISEQERLEQMRQDFIANTSHELKTPVGAITLLAEAIDFAADDPGEVRRFVSRLTAEAERLAQLTGRIMHLSRLQAAAEINATDDVAIDEVVTAAVEANSVQAASSDVSLVRGGERGLFVRGDGQILIEAVSNLIANAISYSPKGSRVGIGVRSDEETIEITVTDQGIGIPEEDQERVFERFYRADQARSRRTGGTGLGLSIVKHAVYRHGGEVRLWSRPELGSTFTIRLPRIDAPVRDDRDVKKRKNQIGRATGKTRQKEKA